MSNKSSQPYTHIKHMWTQRTTDFIVQKPWTNAKKFLRLVKEFSAVTSVTRIKLFMRQINTQQNEWKYNYTHVKT